MISSSASLVDGVLSSFLGFFPFLLVFFSKSCCILSHYFITTTQFYHFDHFYLHGVVDLGSLVLTLCKLCTDWCSFQLVDLAVASAVPGLAVQCSCYSCFVCRLTVLQPGTAALLLQLLQLSRLLLCGGREGRVWIWLGLIGNEK